MGVIAKNERRPLRPAPAGLHPAVCVDVIDLGLVEHPQFGTRRQVKFRWQIDKVNPDTGKPFLVSRTFTNSLHEKSSLRPFLESWRGNAYTEEEATAGVDIEAEFVGQGCLLQVMHKAVDDRVYANVTAALPMPDGFLAPEPRDYIRERDRVDDDGGTD
jgi:hypothetical protein